jgi:hypothetical protein
MSDDLDDLLRRTMKTLDDQVPSGYFDALPERVSARLAGTPREEEQVMQQGTSGTTNEQAPSTGVPPLATKREEDSGLHDIRNLAQSTKQRLSSRRIGTNPPISDDDVLASSSASWKNLALPQPAKMVSLPEIDELPSKQEVIARDKAAKAAAKAAARESKQELAAPAAPVSAAAVEASASARVEYKPAFSAFAAKKPASPHRSRNLALVGMGLAAAAGVTIFVMTQKSSSSDKAMSAAPAAESATRGVSSKGLDEATAKLEAQHAAANAEADKTAAASGAAVVAAPAPAASEDGKDDTSLAKPATKASAPKQHSVVITSKTGKPDKPDEKVEAPPKVEKKAKGGEPGDPSFDDLLKEAGVDAKKTDKPKLDKKQLSGDDFKKGMGAIQAKAAACYKGTQGTAAVKLTVAPSGQVSKVTVSGQFAGKPEADCVVSAVKSASFPPWDGGPQSFGYPILLSE